MGGDFVTLKKKGINYQACCPFHNEKTPSFVVSPSKGLFKCFGCGKGGNAVTFVMEHENMTYPEALKYVARKYGIEVAEREQTPEEVRRNDDRESMMVVSSYAADYFVRTLHDTPEGQSIGIGYFRGHTMVWDWPSSQTTNPDGTYRFDDNIPERLWKAIQAGDQAAVERYYQEWIRTAAETFSYVGEWDVLNEPTANHNLMDRYGMQLAQKWFA